MGLYLVTAEANSATSRQRDFATAANDDDRWIEERTRPYAVQGNGLIEELYGQPFEFRPNSRRYETFAVLPMNRCYFSVGGHPWIDCVHRAFKIRSTESIVFQLRVVAEAPKSLSIWPR